MKGNKWLKVIREENNRYLIIDRKTKDCLIALDSDIEVQTYLDAYSEGRCPRCGENNLDYSDTDNTGESIGYHFICPNCRAKGVEWHEIVYYETILD